VKQRQTRLPKTIDITVAYLRSGRPADTYARAWVSKFGRRIANVRVEAWQYEVHEPIASLHGHFLVTPAEA
jgi:acyl-coenzyme A thioesterase PaaI-like protein